jgi:RIO kinase 1
MNSKLTPNDIIDEDGLARGENQSGYLESAAKLEKKKSEQAVLFRITSKKKKKMVKKSEHVVLDEMIRHSGSELVADEQAFRPTFTSSHQEREWILSYLGPFYDEQMITDVIARVKGGKEANVYCCTAFPGLGVDLVAAKVYRPRMFRSLRNDALYREGRGVIDDEGKKVRNEKILHAVHKGSAYGKELAHTSWLGHEYHALEVLHAAGADVPRPYACHDNTILMDYLGEASTAAPTLNEVHLPNRAEAKNLYERLLHNVEIMLAKQYIHGDLSAYNVLYWQGEFLIIDFPQAVNPTDNRSAFNILKRDLARLGQYFERYGIHSNPEALANQLWNKYGYGSLWAADHTDWEDKNGAG